MQAKSVIDPHLEHVTIEPCLMFVWIFFPCHLWLTAVEKVQRQIMETCKEKFPEYAGQAKTCL